MGCDPRWTLLLVNSCMLSAVRTRLLKRGVVHAPADASRLSL